MWTWVLVLVRAKKLGIPLRDLTIGLYEKKTRTTRKLTFSQKVFEVPSGLWLWVFQVDRAAHRADHFINFSVSSFHPETPGCLLIPFGVCRYKLQTHWHHSLNTVWSYKKKVSRTQKKQNGKVGFHFQDTASATQYALFIYAICIHKVIFLAKKHLLRF